MGFVLRGLDKSDYDREYGDWPLLKRIVSYFKPYAGIMMLIAIGISLSSLFGALVPLFISRTLDVMADSTASSRYPPFIINSFNWMRNFTELSEINLLIVLVMGFAVLQFFFNALRQILTATAVQNAVFDLREEAFNALLDRDMSFFDNQPTGRLASRTVNDTNDYGQVITLTVNLLGQIVIVVFVLYFLFSMSIKLTFLVMIFAPIVVFTALAFRKIARKVALGSQRILAKVNALIQETTSGIYIAKSFRAEDTIYDEFEEMNETSYDVNLRRGLVFNSIFPILTILIGFGTAMIVYFGGLSILESSTFLSNLVAFLPGSELTVGEWFFFLQGLNLFFFPLVSIASFWSQFQQGLAASERIFSLIDADNNVIQYDNEMIVSPQGEIKFDNVTFGYNDEEMVLENFDLHVKPGEKLAIVGHTGAGKSTIVKLIQRYYEFQDGKILIDGQNIRSLDLEEYRKQLSIISQDVFLWNGTIRENLLYGIEHIEDHEQKIEKVLEEVKALEWISNLEKGLDTEVGERGGNLSMGQRQLIAFARILLRDPSILIMDEATASLDPFSDLLVQRATNRILEGRTSIIIAHRLSTIKHVDRIIVMKDGEIIEVGNHDELMKTQGHYAELYNTYFRHQSLEYVEEFAESAD